MSELTIERIRLFALRSAPGRGPLSSLGPMPTRNGLLVEITTKEGATGWGEVQWHSDRLAAWRSTFRHPASL